MDLFGRPLTDQSCWSKQLRCVCNSAFQSSSAPSAISAISAGDLPIRPQRPFVLTQRGFRIASSSRSSVVRRCRNMGTGGGIGIDGNHDSAWNRSTQTFTNPSPLHRSNVHTPTADLQFRGTTPRAAAQGLRPCARSEVRGRRSAPERFARVTGPLLRPLARITRLSGICGNVPCH